VSDAARADRRRRLRHSVREIACEAPAKPDGLIAAEALRVLTRRERVVCSSFLRGDSTRSVCQQLGLTVNALTVHLSRARRKLVEELRT
jgi:DNA-binding CsgD family transcriptional regulator